MAIALLRKPPFELSYSWVSLGFIIAFVSMLQWGAQKISLSQNSLALLWVYVITQLICRVVPLLIANKKERMNQTLVALFGTDLIIFVPKLFMIATLDLKSPSPVSGMLITMLLAWQVAVSAHIYRFALNATLWLAIVTAIGVTLTSAFLANQLAVVLGIVS